MNFHGWEHTWNNLGKQYVKWKIKILDLVVYREEAKKAFCVIDDKYITLGEENGPSLLQEVITNVEDLWKKLENEF